MNAVIASVRSSEDSAPAFHVATYSNPSATERLSPAASTALVPCTASGELAAISVARAVASRQLNFESGYSPDEIANARKFVANPDWGAMMRDVAAAIDEAKKSGPAAIIGFCMGGTIAFLAAAKLNGLSAAIGYYGGQIAKNADEKPKVPVQLHFGEKDASIPMSDVEIIKAKRGGDCEIYVYPDAQHGFHCDERGSYNEAAAKLAWQRSSAFLEKHLKK